MFSKLRGDKDSEAWQSSYTPTPAPAPTHRAAGEEDGAGASPDEAIADAAESPRPATDPDRPAEVVDVDKKTD